MPFGLCNVPATFERMIDSLLRGLKWSTCLCYLDDLIVFSATFESHLQGLRTILSVFRSAGLQLNSSKCHFASGHSIGAVLAQHQQGHDHVTAYASHLLPHARTQLLDN